MESRFAALRQRDSSVSMLRVKVSRRRSQCQKENRGKAVNSRRQLEKLSELEQSSIMEASVLTRNMSVVQEKSANLLKAAKADAGLDRLKQLERWKERKTLEKEKIKRENDRKNVFKTGLYHSKDTFAFVVLPQVPKSKARPREAVVSAAPPSRVTRSGKRQQQNTKSLPPQKEPEKMPAVRKAEPAAVRTTRSRAAVAQPAPAVTRAKATAVVEPQVRPCSTRSGASVPKAKDRHPADASPVRATRTHSKKAELSSGKTTKVTFEEQPISPQEQEACPPTKMEEEEEEEAAPPAEAPASFAPQGFVFQAPTGLSSFKFDPLTPRTAESFLRPSFTLPPFPAYNEPSEVEPSGFVSLRSPPRIPPAPPAPQEPQHDVPYFRLQVSLETEKLTSLSAVWEPRVDDPSIPEDMRDCMRTVVGQARLLMKERFGQFSGLVEDCELGRGEKTTTCTDLQGFWEMVYYQVEDVEKKFAALTEAEARNWAEEVKAAAAPRQRKVKKPPTAAPTAPRPAGASAAVRSRLAAAKAAMKAKKQAAEATPPQEATPPAPETVVFEGGFFQVESPAKTPATRRSLRLSAAVPPHGSPHRSLLKHCTPRATTTSTPARATPTPARATTTSTPARATPTPARATTTSTPARATTTPRATTTSTPARATTTSTPARATPTPARATTTTTPAKATVTPARPTTTPARVTRRSQFTAQSQDAPQEAHSATPASPAARRRVLEAHSLSFSLSPCPGDAPDPGPPARPALQGSQGDVEQQESVSETPDSSVIENVPGLDFERYLLPTATRSPSPVAMDTLSPAAADFEMGSPAAAEAGSRDTPPQAEPQGFSPAGLHPVSSALTPLPQQTAQSDLLLFTPDLRDRIRASVCPSDLMVFTPPPSQ